MKYYLVAGEASGDLHASNLMKGLKAEDPAAEFRFWGGDKMLAVGGTLVQHYKQGAVMGVSDVLRKSGKLLANLKACKRDILSWQPDVLILVDYPGFNLKLASFAHKKGLKVFYYIAPKTWASRPSRNRQLKKNVDMLYIVFPFEKEYFSKQGINYVYLGNPLVEAVEQARTENLCSSPYIAVLPGSRAGEISRTMPIVCKVADELHSLPQYSKFQFLIAGAPARDSSDYAPYLQGREAYMQLYFDKSYSIVKGAQAAIVNSGTASLETALLGTAQLVCWSTSPFTAFLAQYVLRVLDKIKYVSLANLIDDSLIFKEFLQQSFNPSNVLEELRHILEDENYRNTMLEGYERVKKALGQGNASRAFARDMIERLNSH